MPILEEPDPYFLSVLHCVLNKTESQIVKFHGMEATFKFLALAFSWTFMALCSYNIYVFQPSQLAELLLCLSINNQLQLAILRHGLPTLAAPYNKIFPTLPTFDFKQLEIICEPRNIKCFQTIFSNSFYPARLKFLQLASQLLGQISCSHAEQTYYFMLNFRAYLSVPKLNQL